MLTLADYDVITAVTGQECLRIVRSEHPDLVLLDVVLPDISGVEVCQRIKADPELAGILVVHVTGILTSSDDEATGIEAGADAYLPKPFHLRTLLARVQNLLRIKQAETDRELDSLERFPREPAAAVAAQSFGLKPLGESLPALFEELVQHYCDLLDSALERRIYRVSHPLSESLRAFGDQLGFLKAGPRDVVQIHHAALQKKAAAVTLAKARAYLDEGRLLVLELMGDLVAYYRNHALSARAFHGPERRAVPRKAP